MSKMSDCKLQQDEIVTIAEYLRSTNSIEHLILTSNLISEPATKHLSKHSFIMKVSFV